MILEQIKIFYDGVNIEKYGSLSYVKGFTTNPTLMKNANTKYNNYKDFALNFLKQTRNMPVSFEVFADDLDGMIKQAKVISAWGDNIYVKIPIINTKGVSTQTVIEELNKLNIKVNITAVFTKKQIDIAVKAIQNISCSNILSIFCGRIADTGVDPIDICKYAIGCCKNKNIEILWASSREILNIFQAAKYGCDIITLNDSIIKKIPNIGKKLETFSLETVKMFVNDAVKSGISF